MTTMLNMKQAASYCGLPLSYFKHQVKHRTGPHFISPSERVKFFTVADLDAWIKTWKRSDQTGET